MTPVEIILAEIDEAKAAVIFWKREGPRIGNVQACIAAFKVAWLKEILEKINRSRK